MKLILHSDDVKLLIEALLDYGRSGNRDAADLSVRVAAQWIAGEDEFLVIEIRAVDVARVAAPTLLDYSYDSPRGRAESDRVVGLCISLCDQYLSYADRWVKTHRDQ